MQNSVHNCRNRTQKRPVQDKDSVNYNERQCERRTRRGCVHHARTEGGGSGETSFATKDNSLMRNQINLTWLTQESHLLTINQKFDGNNSGK